MDRYGYWNKILHVDLADRRTWIEEPGDAFFRRYAGGRGLIAHYLLKYVPKGADPLGPDNILVIAPGVITGAPVPFIGRNRIDGVLLDARGLVSHWSSSLLIPAARSRLLNSASSAA